MEDICVWRTVKKGSFIVALCWLCFVPASDFLTVLYLNASEREGISVAHWQYVELGRTVIPMEEILDLGIGKKLVVESSANKNSHA